eukprot:c10908_g1_i3.p1 GENE.c10908_g1_i3~~c10908_g1_i3.p1  ORF type:complete len:367 (-),score=85.83 c10908_g1_i3:124-1224(-)
MCSECRHLEISGLPVDDIQSSTLGMYERTETMNRNKPVYKQVGGSHFLFAFNPSLWVVGGVVGVDDGKLLVWDSAVEPRNIKSTWQAYNGKEWDFVPTLGAKCRELHEIDWMSLSRLHTQQRSLSASPAQQMACSRLRLVGQTNQDLHFGMMGMYQLSQETTNERPVWTQLSTIVGSDGAVSKVHHLFSIHSIERVAWIVGTTVGKDDAGIVVWDNARHPKDIRTTWKYWDTIEWVDDKRIRIECMDRVVNDPPTQSPLALGVCDRLSIIGLGPGDLHNFMMGKYVLHQRPIGGKVAFKQEDGDQFLFSLMDGKVWAVGSKPGVDDVGILVWDMSDHPTYIKREWQMWNGHKWVTQPRIRIRCDVV